MPQTTFTTWTALLATMMDQLASQNITVTSVTIDGNLIQYRTLKELREQIDYVRTMAAYETGTIAPRTYAGQGGRCE
ncbi:MAG: hypothetical protein HY770_06285 [Chitinivibrionia bacterium]|nr:hypothetical protein [Chitinivibrionia bacterium]